MSKKTKAARKVAAKNAATKAVPVKQVVQERTQAAPEKTTAEPKGDALDVSAVSNAPMLEANLGTLTTGAEPQKTLPTEETAESPILPPARETEPLRLPRGAFLALRKSGGLHFSTRAVVLYPDGRVSYDERGVPQKDYNRLPRVLNDGQVLSLRKLLDQTNFWRAESSGEQNPDTFAYEIAARLGQRANSVQIFDGNIPDKLKPLLERLTPLLPRAQEG